MKMPKRDYFLMCLEAGCYRYKQWTLELFTLTRPGTGAPRSYPYALTRDETGVWFTNADGQRVDVTGGHKDGPLCSLYDELVLSVGDLPNVKTPTISTYGQAFLNQLCLVHPFGTKLDYMNGENKPGKIEAILEKRIVDADDPNPPADAITIAELQRFNEACIMAAEYATVAVPAASVKTMTVDPKILKRRAELIKQYKDKLDDPVIQTLIGDELIQMDREWMAGDVGEGFYFKPKSYEIVRKKLFLTSGAEGGFDIAGSFQDTALDEGWDITNLPNIVNGIRDGSYNRGAMTAKGGEATKFNYRIFQNTRIAEEDCGSPYGMDVVISEKQKQHYISNSIIAGKTLVELTPENIDKYVGKTVALRTPIYCRTSGTNFCATCIGKRIAQTSEAIATYAADIGSTFMYIMMKSMHGKTMSVAEYIPSLHLR